MTNAMNFAVRFLLAGLLLSILGAAPLRAADAAHVVELFQSQGCSSCPPANANLLAIADRPGILALSFGVTYWDYLGWKDTFASPEFTQRQWEYARGLHHSNVFTPQIVINGRTDVVGIKRAELEAAIAEIKPLADAPAIAFGDGVAAIGAGKGRADVLLVRYNPNIVRVPVARGENGGLTLPHRNVVRTLEKLGEWTGDAQTYRLPRATEDGLRDAILVQQGPGGPILAAAHN